MYLHPVIAECYVVAQIGLVTKHLHSLSELDPRFLVFFLLEKDTTVGYNRLSVIRDALCEHGFGPREIVLFVLDSGL